MKVVILAGGFGTRISEESQSKPKPMICIGDKPILWHIMQCYSQYGFNEFIICAGYLQQVIKDWFADYFLHSSNVTFDYRDGKLNMTVHESKCEPWKVTVVDTGLNTMTGGRLKRVRDYVCRDGNERFFLTYGDAVCNVNIERLLKFHETHGKIGTLTAVHMGQDKGVLDIDEQNSVRAFREKSSADSKVINAGFMVFEPEIFDYIKGDETVFEREPLEKLAAEGQLKSFVFDGFWQCMDSLREKQFLERLYNSGKAPWTKNWR